MQLFHDRIVCRRVARPFRGFCQHPESSLDQSSDQEWSKPNLIRLPEVHKFEIGIVSLSRGTVVSYPAPPIQDMLHYSTCTTLCHHHRVVKYFATISSLFMCWPSPRPGAFSCHYSKSTMPAQRALTKQACILHTRMRLELSSKSNQILSRDTLLSVCAPTRC